MMRGTLSRTALALLLGVVSLALFYDYATDISLRHTRERAEMHERILRNDIESPYAYRILVPFAAEGARRTLAGVIGPERALVVSYLGFELLAFAALVLLAYAHLRASFAPVPCLFGVLWMAALLPVALRDHYFQPWSLAEPVFFLAAFVAMARNARGVQLVLVLVATLNRETALFLALACACDWTDPLAVLRGQRRLALKDALQALVPLVLWAITYATIRALRGGHPHLYPLSAILEGNLRPESLARTALNVSLFCGSWVVLGALARRALPAHVRRALPAMVAHLAALVVFSWWYEVRLLMPFYPWLLPAGLGFFFVPTSSGTRAA